MALKVDYVLRETGASLRRNVSLTLASLLTVTVSLSLVGAVLLLRQGVDHATKRWANGVEFIVFMNPDASQDQIDSIQRDLSTHPEVKTSEFVNKQQSYDEAKQLFRDQPELLDTITADDMPSQFRVKPKHADENVIKSLGSQFEKRPGVNEVAFPGDTVKFMRQTSHILQVSVLVTAIILLGAAAMLIINTIRTAMFARRREIEVMKLVGATNWFIRVPFMVEGLIQGLIGALLAVGGVAALRDFIESRFAQSDIRSVVGDFTISGHELFGTSTFLVIVGVLLGAVGSGIAVSRFLDV